MKISKQEKGKSEVLLKVEITEEEMKTYREKTAEKLQTKVKVAGFRPGHIPTDVLVKEMGEDAFTTEMLDLALQMSYGEALEKEEVRAIDYPKIKLLSHEPLSYEAVVTTMPELKWKKDIKKLKVKRKKVDIEDKDIKKVLEDLQTRFKKWQVVDRKAKKGDKVEIDFDGFSMEGEPLAGTQSKNHPLVLGDGNFIPGFEEEIEGLSKGDEKEFDIVFPKDYHSEDFKGKKVKFKIKVHQIEASEDAQLTDAFAVEVTGGNRKTLDELKDEIKEELTRHKAKEERAIREEAFLDELKSFVDLDVPEVLVEREIDFLITRQPEARKKDKKPEDLRKELKESALSHVIIRMALEKLQEATPMEASPEEIQEELLYRLEMFPREIRPMVMERYKEGSQDHAMLVGQVKLSKLVDAHTE